MDSKVFGINSCTLAIQCIGLNPIGHMDFVVSEIAGEAQTNNSRT